MAPRDVHVPILHGRAHRRHIEVRCHRLPDDAANNQPGRIVGLSLLPDDATRAELWRDGHVSSHMKSIAA